MKTKSGAVQVKAKILDNKEVAKGFYKLSVFEPNIARRAKPGQFLNIKINDTYQPLLRKPLGINSIKIGSRKIDILYRVAGKGTQALAYRKKGEYVDILGPLGKGFDYRSKGLKHRPKILVAGGIGVAPLLFLAEKLKQRDTVVIIGANTRNQLLCEKEFKALGCGVYLATDDGSKGLKGTAIDLLEKVLLDSQYALRPIIYVCGPRAMLKATSDIGQRLGITCFGLLEEYMACGTGACFGCVVLTESGFKRVCKDGPVFDLGTIEW